MNILYLLSGLPLASGALFFTFNNLKVKYRLSIFTAGTHLIITYLLFAGFIAPPQNAWFNFDSLTKLFLMILSNVFFWVTANSYKYIKHSPIEKIEKSRQIFYNMTNLYLFANTLALISNHLGLYWVALESTTLCVAPLIYFYRDKESLEAMWKYLFLVSVGLAFAFIGILFLTLSAHGTEFMDNALYITVLVSGASKLNLIWLKAGFIFIFVGLSAKIGIAPIHPGEVDAVSNSPSPVAALISASLGGTALMGVLRILQILSWTSLLQFAQILLIIGGTVSLAVALIFMFRVTNYKRMIAYSSVEHMGIVLIGFGIGGIALTGALLHLIFNSLNKTAFFFMAGNIHRNYKSREIGRIYSLLNNLRWTGILFLISFLAVIAMPPFGLFFSELMLLQGLIANNQFVLMTFIIILLLFIFIGMSRNVFRMLYRTTDKSTRTFNEHFEFSHLSAIVLLCILAGLGIFIPEPLAKIISDVTRLFVHGI